MEIKSGTTMQMSIDINEVKVAPIKNGLIVLTKPNEHNPKGVWQFVDAQATNTLVGVGIRGAKEDMEGAILELQAAAAISKAHRQPCKLTYQAVYGVAGETYVDRFGEVRTYSKTGWNSLSPVISLSEIAQGEIAQSNRDLRTAIMVATATRGRKTYSTAPVVATTQPAVTADDAHPFNEPVTKEANEPITNAEVESEVEQKEAA